MKGESGALAVGDHVRVFLNSEYWRSGGWFDGTIVRIDPYSAHRSFYWVELQREVEVSQGGKSTLVSVLNPKHILKA